jgi:hypothetical protein
MTARKARTEILMRLSELSLELVSVFTEVKRNFLIICLHKVLNLFTRPSQKYSAGDPGPIKTT